MKMRLVAIIMILVLPLLGQAAAALSADRHMVLVAAEGFPVENLPLRELRKAYLGLPVEHESMAVEPLRNLSDPLLYDVFLQKVVFMSRRSYERELLSRVFRLGGTRPVELSAIEQVVAALHAHPGAVTFMWEDTASGLDNVRVVQTLWQGSLH